MTRLVGMDADGEPILLLRLMSPNTFIVNITVASGGMDTGFWRHRNRSGKCFLIEVPDRSAAILQPLIEQYILPGSHIMSDGCAAYANIDAIRHGIYFRPAKVQK